MTLAVIALAAPPAWSQAEVRPPRFIELGAASAGLPSPFSRVSSVARLGRAASVIRHAVLENGSTAERCTPPVLASNDDAAVFRDAWVAIARGDPYRVDWRNPAHGALNLGVPLDVALPTVTSADRQAILDSFPHRVNRMPEFDFDHFPKRVPAFQDGALLAMPSGDLLVRRTLTASSARQRYDIIGRDSHLVAVLYTPRNQVVVGFGKRFVYVVETDADGLQHLRLHSLPRR